MFHTPPQFAVFASGGEIDLLIAYNSFPRGVGIVQL